MTTASTRPARLRLPAIALALSLLGSFVAAVPAAAAEKPFRYDLYREGDFVSQITAYMCVGASMQMMLNLIGRDDRSSDRQHELWTLARSFRRTNDPMQMNSGINLNRTRRGASSRGWAAGLTQLGAGPYVVTAADTIDAAALLAAKQMRKTGRPVGLLVWRGAHAWVVSGFQATGDPLTNPKAKVTHVYVLDPWYPRVSRTWGPGIKPHSRLSIAQLGQDWVQWRRSMNRPGLSNRWAMVLPYVAVPPDGRRPALAH